MNYDLILPNELIQIIGFLETEDFFIMPFLGKDYEIIAKDDVGNFIGTALNKQVFYLETAFDKHLDTIKYITDDIAKFIQELNLYKHYTENYYLEENPADEELEKYADGFKKLILTVDQNAFRTPDTYWSVIVEQMAYGLI